MPASAQLQSLTSPDSAAFFTPRTIALLPIGSTEPHGPHLPLDTDVTIALAQARATAELLAPFRLPALILPPLAFGITNFTDGFPGRITLRPGTLWALLEDLVASLEQQEIRQVVFANAHLEPAHVEILRGVEFDHPVRGPQKAQVLFPDNTRRRWAQTLGEEFASGDCHAGRYETSLVLAAEPASVREEARRSLAPVRIDLLTKMQAGARTFLEAGATSGYCGDPAAASPEEGRESIESLARMMVASIRECWPDLFA